MAHCQLRNSENCSILQADLLDSRDRNLVCQFLDSTGGDAFTTAITVNLDSEVINTADTVFSISSDVVSIARNGIFLVQYQVTVEHTFGTGTTGTVRAFLQQNIGGGGWNDVNPSYYGTLSGSGYYVSAGGMIPMFINNGTDLRLRVERADNNTQNYQTVQNHSHLMIMCTQLLDR